MLAVFRPADTHHIDVRCIIGSLDEMPEDTNTGRLSLRNQLPTGTNSSISVSLPRHFRPVNLADKPFLFILTGAPLILRITMKLGLLELLFLGTLLPVVLSEAVEGRQLLPVPCGRRWTLPGEACCSSPGGGKHICGLGMVHLPNTHLSLAISCC